MSTESRNAVMDIKALIATLRCQAKNKFSYYHLSQDLMEAADALESTNAVVEAAQELEESNWDGSFFRLSTALEALDAPKEGDG